jgi:hypothetical protein
MTSRESFSYFERFMDRVVRRVYSFAMNIQLGKIRCRTEIHLKCICVTAATDAEPIKLSKVLRLPANRAKSCVFPEKVLICGSTQHEKTFKNVEK